MAKRSGQTDTNVGATTQKSLSSGSAQNCRPGGDLTANLSLSAPAKSFGESSSCVVGGGGGGGGDDTVFCAGAGAKSAERSEASPNSDSKAPELSKTQQDRKAPQQQQHSKAPPPQQKHSHKASSCSISNETTTTSSTGAEKTTDTAPDRDSETCIPPSSSSSTTTTTINNKPQNNTKDASHYHDHHDHDNLAASRMNKDAAEREGSSNSDGDGGGGFCYNDRGGGVCGCCGKKPRGGGGCCGCCGGCCGEKKSRGLPPGPSGAPLVGAALRWEGPETNWAWTQQFGPIYSVKMGTSQLVYLNTIELVEKYLERQGSKFLGRPEGPAAIANGLLFGQGERWAENRRAFVRVFGQASFISRCEHNIQLEMDYVVEQLKGNGGQPVEVRQLLLPAFTHRLVTLFLGHSLDRDDADMVTLVEQMTVLVDDVDLMSIALKLFLKVKRFRGLLEWLSGGSIPDMFRMSEVEQTLIQGWIARRREALAQSGGQPDPNSLLDQLLTSPEYVSRGQDFDPELTQSLMDLFNGGIAPCLSVLDFALLHLLHHPHVQDKVRAEVLHAATQGHRISWSNRGHFPYTQATLLEVLRLGAVTPSSLPHCAVEDTEVEGFRVPRGVIVLASIYSLHRDPRFYHEAEEFRPERHLREEGGGGVVVVEPQSFRPFGVGPRLCLGYHMAHMELFVCLARLVSAFRFRAQDPSHPPPFRTKMRVVRRLESFRCIAEHLDTAL